MLRPIVVGLTGPFQHGKSELRPQIEGAGWRFIDLNDFQNARRLPGSARYDLYQQHLPGSLNHRGSFTASYYQQITPEMRAVMLPAEAADVAEMARQAIAALAGSDRAIISWETWPSIIGQVPIDHMIVLRQSRERWFQRLHQRIVARGWGSWTPGDDELQRIITTLGAEPEDTQAAMVRAMPDAHTIVDVSPDDWGAPELLRVLEGLAQPE